MVAVSTPADPTLMAGVPPHVMVTYAETEYCGYHDGNVERGRWSFGLCFEEAPEADSASWHSP